MTEIKYDETIMSLTREQLIEKLRQALSKSRFEHVLRVEQTAIELAQKNDVDIQKASIAGLVHDYAKQRPDEDFIQVIKQQHLSKELLDYGNAIWHGVVGAEMIKTELGIGDEDILNAVRHHTTGAPVMSKLEQIVYMADYIEPARDFDGVEVARKLTQSDLAAGVAIQTKQTLTYLIQNQRPIYPKTIDTYNEWVAK